MENNVNSKQDQIKSVLEDVVTNIVTKVNERMDKVQEDIVVKIKDAVSTDVKTPKISGGRALLEDDPKGGFKGFWHFLRDVARSDQSGGRLMSKELSEWNKITKAAGTGLSESDDQYGGYLVPSEFRRQLISHINESNELINKCTIIPMATNIIELPMVNGYDQSSGYVSGGVVALWTDEEDETVASRARFAKIQLKLHKLTCLSYVTDEILSDSPISMESILMNGFRNAINFQYNKVIIRGTGAGQPQGLIVSPAKVTVSKEVGQTAGTIYFDNIMKMYQAIYNPVGAVWIANPNTMSQLVSMSLVVGGGGVPVWMPAGGVSGKTYNTLFGLPIIFNDHCSTLGTEGDIILVNLSEYYIGRKAAGEDLQYNESIHVKFEYAQTVFRVITRLAGQMSWPTYYKPPQATTSYRSPVVTLETRS